MARSHGSSSASCRSAARRSRNTSIRLRRSLADGRGRGGAPHRRAALETLCVATATGIDARPRSYDPPGPRRRDHHPGVDGVRAASDLLSKSDPPPSDEGHACPRAQCMRSITQTGLPRGRTLRPRRASRPTGREISAAAPRAQSTRDAAGAAANLAVASGPGHAADDELARPLPLRRPLSLHARKPTMRPTEFCARRPGSGRSPSYASRRHARHGRVRQGHREPSDRARRRRRAHEPACASRARRRASRARRRASRMEIEQ